VSGMLVETSASFPSPATPFAMINLGDVHNLTGATLNTTSNTAGVSQFLRPEDGAWDPRHPEDFYFVTTNAFNSPSRLWRMHFTNINDLTQGGVITAVLDGTEGQQMFDNIAIDHWGHILLQEDVGNNAHLGKIWQYTIASDELKQICSHDATRFLNGGANFLTQDEEGSGIIDVQEILGAGMFLMVDQAHYTISGDAVEGGQLLALFNPDTYAACASYSGNVAVSPSPTVSGQVANTIYLGYGPQSLTLSASVPSGFPPYTYAWSPGSSTNNSIIVSPTATTTYTVTIKNAFGCAVSVSKTITVKDIRDGSKNKVFICHNGHTESVSVNAVPAFLVQNDQLGDCETEHARSTVNAENQLPNQPELYPNPAANLAIISLKLERDEHIRISVFDLQGRKAIRESERIFKAGLQQVILNISQLNSGTYFARITYGSTVNLVKMVVIH